MKPARILLLLVAIVAGGLAAFLATRNFAPQPQVIVQQAGTPAPETHTADQVLVATADIGVGQRLDAKTVKWQDWPTSAITDQYIINSKSPDAIAKISGTVARFEIFPGEPILDAKLAHSDQGFLSAVLEPGMRGVSVSVSAVSSSGGFVIPNDRVDLVLTSTATGQTTSRVLLADVKVLAIGTRLGQTGTTGAPANPDDPKSQIFTADTIATLELTPQQAQTLINATAQGKISLVLRSVADFGRTATTAAASDTGGTPNGQPIQVIRFGRSAAVTPGSDSGPPPVISTTAYEPPAPATPAVTPDAAVDAPAPVPPTTVVTTVTGPTTYVAPGDTTPSPLP